MREINEKAEFYSISANEAREINQTDAWRESHWANKACRDYIDSHETGLSATAYKNDCVDADGSYAQCLIERFGYRRTMCVLAATIDGADWDMRYSAENKSWAKAQIRGMDAEQTKGYRLSGTHPGLTDILTNHVRQEYNALGLYTAEHCEADSFGTHDYSGKILVVAPESLPEEYWQPENQIFRATHGNGCSPTTSGRKVYGEYPFDGEETYRNRAEFIGVMKEEFIPQWVREKLEQAETPEQTESEGMGMEMS